MRRRQSSYRTEVVTIGGLGSPCACSPRQVLPHPALLDMHPMQLAGIRSVLDPYGAFRSMGSMGDGMSEGVPSTQVNDPSQAVGQSVGVAVVGTDTSLNLPTGSNINAAAGASAPAASSGTVVIPETVIVGPPPVAPPPGGGGGGGGGGAQPLPAPAAPSSPSFVSSHLPLVIGGGVLAVIALIAYREYRGV